MWTHDQRSRWFTASGLAIGRRSGPVGAGAEAVDAVLRGLGQVMLQNNSYAGLLFLIGLFWNSWLFAVAALVGTVAATATAWLMDAQRADIRAGLYGFNGALVGIGLLYFLHPVVLTWIYVIVAAGCSTVVMAALSRWLDAWRTPALTAPFVITTLLFILACARLGRLQVTDVLPVAGLPQATTVQGVVTAATLAHGLFTGVAQVFFQGSLMTGVFFLLGLLVSSRSACAAALLGSIGGMLVAWALGASEPAIRAGAFGFNPVLTAIALGSGCFLKGAWSWAYALLGVVVTTVVYAALSAALEPLGMPALTAPFVLVVWLFLMASPRFSRLCSAADAA
ncbi:MAG TPA: urea transporter [Nevskiaceae bacterium]|nr:urea transporter [Nevskiaceae bacterium]